jgi:hypothetical protein
MAVLFLAKSLTLVLGSKEYRGYYLHEAHVQHAIKLAVRRSRIAKRASAHTLRHGFASHLLQANVDDLHSYRVQSDDQRSEKSAGFLSEILSLAVMDRFAAIDQYVFCGCNWPIVLKKSILDRKRFLAPVHCL